MITLGLLLSLTLYASDNLVEEKDVFDYSGLCLNNTLSLYAAKVNMNYFEDDAAYSIGLLLHDSKKSHTHFGLGYLHPIYLSDDFSRLQLQDNESEKEDGILFFMNHSF